MFRRKGRSQSAYFKLHLDQYDLFRELSDADAGKIIKAVFSYECNNQVTPLEPQILMQTFVIIRRELDLDKITRARMKEINSKCYRKKTNGLKGVQAAIQTAFDVKK